MLCFLLTQNTINMFIQQKCIKLIKRGNKDNNVTKYIFFLINAILSIHPEKKKPFSMVSKKILSCKNVFNCDNKKLFLIRS